MDKKKKRVLGSAAVGVASIVAVVIGVVAEIFPLILIGGLVALGALIAGFYFGSPPLRASDHSHGTFTVKGASAEFLDQLLNERPPEPMNW